MHAQVFESGEGFFSFPFLPKNRAQARERGGRRAAEEAHSAENIKASQR